LLALGETDGLAEGDLLGDLEGDLDGDLDALMLGISPKVKCQ
jgi:hypothetical protein